MFIGDLNVNLLKQNKFTRQMKRIISSGYINLNCEEKQITFIADTRIDYVLLHNSLANLNNNATLIAPKCIQENPDDEFGYSDHRMLITKVSI